MRAFTSPPSLPEWGLRLATAGLFLVFWNRAFALWLASPAHLTLLGLLITESLSVMLSLSSRAPHSRDWHPVAVLTSLLATAYFLALDLGGGRAWLPESFCSGLIAAGLLWQGYAKLSLGSAFGLLPAHRAIVEQRAYALVRHPIYLGYLISHCGFLLAHASLHNLLLYAGLYLLQGLRMQREERWLARDPAYRAYQARVRWRLLPGLY